MDEISSARYIRRRDKRVNVVQDDNEEREYSYVTSGRTISVGPIRENNQLIEKVTKNTYEFDDETASLSPPQVASSIKLPRTSDNRSSKLPCRKRTREDIQPKLVESEFDEGEFFKELITCENVRNPIIEKLLEYGEGIARYKIIFLPEDNKQDPIKKLLNDQEWMKSERDWKMVEKRITDSFSFEIPEDIEHLLFKYDRAIEELTVKSELKINKLTLLINESPLKKEITKYVFNRDWILHWIQLVYTSFITIFQMPNDFFRDSDFSEYAYRDRVINRLWEDVFLDVNSEIYVRTGEIEKDRSGAPGQPRATGWYHDAIFIIKFLSKEIQIGFGEVVGNPCKHDDKKWGEDREKFLKAMQLSLYKLRKLLLEKKVPEEDLEKLETFGIQVYKRDFIIYSAHWINGLYLVDQVDGFTIPNTKNQLNELSNIIRAMLEFKYRIINLTNYIKSILKDKSKTFGYRKIISEPDIVNCSQ